jgi:hypothetical protein
MRPIGKYKRLKIYRRHVRSKRWRGRGDWPDHICMRFAKKMVRSLTPERERERISEEGDKIMNALRRAVRDGVREKMCHDCAFLPQSPEMIDSRQTYPSAISTLVEDLDYFFSGQSDHLSIFVCHQGMPTGPNGPPDYRPPRDEHGNPVGYPICAGWRARFDEYISAHNAKREAAGL